MSAELKDAYFAKWFALPLLLRPHHWIKNVFILLPVFFAGQMRSQSVIVEAVAAVFVFCIVSSVVYIVNDLRDMEADRLHEKKKSRPLASGVVPPASAFGLLIALIGGAFLALWRLDLGGDFLLVLLLYVVINIGYSFGLKQVALIEIFLVASGYVIRLIAGGFVAQEQISNWMIVCAALLAMLLTVGKRRGDLAQNNDQFVKRRSLSKYTVPYLDHLLSILAAGILVTYLLFSMSDYAAARFGRHVIISSIFVLFGIMRYLQIVIVESGGDQPANLIYRDRLMLSAVILYFFYFVATIYHDVIF